MENTPQQPNYFRFSDAPSQNEMPKPWFRRPKTLKRIAMIGGILVVLAFLAVLGGNIIKSFSENGPQSERDAAKAEVIQRQADCDEGDEVCKAQAQTEVARTAGVVEACEGLADKELANCVTLIAMEEKESSACDILEGDDKATCRDSVLLARAEGGEGMSICDDVQDSSKKNSCIALVTSTASFSGDCGKYGVDERVCTKDEMLRALLAAGDFTGCSELAEDDRETCIDFFASTDADADGLTAKEEAEIGTSDQDADTDGDGYADGTEVAAGYNPLN